MEVAPEYWQNPETLKDIYVSTSGGAVSGAQATGAIAALDARRPRRRVDPGPGGAQPAHQPDRRDRPRQRLDRCRGQHDAGDDGAAVGAHALRVRHHAAAVNHQGLFVATTISFNLAPGKTLSDAVRYVNDTMREIGTAGHGPRQLPGTARAFQQSLGNQLILILAALAPSTSCSACSTRATSTR